MYEAYKIFSLTKLNYQIESMTADEDTLLVGTRQGFLFMYNIIRNEDKFDVQLMRYNKSFSKKPVQQLQLIPGFRLLVCLTDNMVQLHDVNSINFTIYQHLQPTKGATIFTINREDRTSLTGESSVLVRLAVAVKRKLQLYYLKNNAFLPLMDDLNLTEVPRSMVWCRESICIGYRGEYVLFINNKQEDLFPTSSNRSTEPCIIKISTDTFALCREIQTVLVNVNGKTEKTKAIKWSDIPLNLAWDEPYILGILPESVEVQTLEPGGLVQNFSDLSKVRFLIRTKQGLLYAASTTQIWAIYAVDIPTQRKVLLDSKQFQLALKLTQVSNELEEEKNEKIHQIQTLLAYDLFANKKFHESMMEFLKLGTDPYDVIRLFPDLLPQTIENEEVNKNLTDKELESGLLALIDYLTEVRLWLLYEDKDRPAINPRGNLNERINNSKSIQQLLQIIDTTLLKCYLRTNDVLVAPLLRLNHCHLGETEKILKKMGKHNELIILYQTKGQHWRALEVLKTDRNIERTIYYLQHLGSEHMGLILEFAGWVLNEAPDEGLKIFVEDVIEIEQLPRPRVLDFLLRSHPNFVIPYLEHVVHVWEDTNPLFHNALIHQYKEKALSDEFIRKKLNDFLKKSQYYTPDIVIHNFPSNNLLDEMAIILGRLGKHEDSIAIYVRGLGDIDKAVNYCKEIYDTDAKDKEKIFIYLIKLILNPSNCSLYLPDLKLSPKTAQPNVPLALSLFKDYANKMDPLEALNILPDDISINEIHKFLLSALQKVVQERRRMELLKALLYIEILQYKEMRFNIQNQKVLVTELNVCPVCKKRFGNQSALVRYPNGDVVHFSCHEKKS